ncbi:hypothetical protein BpHYR1_052670 [Brachionus plicatilis]|uniref:Uncharacterized protein n=1 Tax=Brachionus plicatilis TaxID=10195 RepID=A0A3M7QF25_BRAPC|nr:hypothetical protein BpHYR1_052670 [Brachionus plicatilis]
MSVVYFEIEQRPVHDLYHVDIVCVSNSWIIYKQINAGAKSLHNLREFTLMVSVSLMRAGKDITQAPKLVSDLIKNMVKI